MNTRTAVAAVLLALALTGCTQDEAGLPPTPVAPTADAPRATAPAATGPVREDEGPGTETVPPREGGEGYEGPGTETVPSEREDEGPGTDVGPDR